MRSKRKWKTDELTGVGWLAVNNGNGGSSVQSVGTNDTLSSDGQASEGAQTEDD